MLTENEMAYLGKHLTFWKELSTDERNDIKKCAFSVAYPKGKTLYGGLGHECLGLVLIESGQLRAFIASQDGKEISLYRLLELDICILSASCMIKNMNFDITIELEKDSRIYIIPTACFNRISEKNVAVKNFALELVSARFSDVMWVFEQYVFGSAAQRLAGFLVEQSQLEGTDTLAITHEFIANDLGTAREVITRLLKHFAGDGMVSLARGTVTIENLEKLKKLC